MSEGLRTNPIVRSTRLQRNAAPSASPVPVDPCAPPAVTTTAAIANQSALRPLEGNVSTAPSVGAKGSTGTPHIGGGGGGNIPKSRVPATRMANAAAVVRGGSSPRKEVRSPLSRTANNTHSGGGGGGDQFVVLERLEQMESVMDYIVGIAQAVAQRTRSLPPPASLEQFRASVAPGSRFTPQADQTEHYSLLSDLHETCNTLLSWFSRLEYAKLGAAPQHDARELERETLATSGQVMALVEKVDRKFSMHEDGQVREAYGRRRHTVGEVRELLDALAQTTQLMVLLRRQAEAHNASRTEDLLEAFHRMVRQCDERRAQEQAAGADGSSIISGGSSVVYAAAYLQAMLHGPFFAWLERRWLPAMRAWAELVRRAADRAAAGDVEAALLEAEEEMVLIPALQEVLRPGESLSDLFDAQVRRPLTAERGQLCATLREAIRCGTVGDALVEAIQAAEAYFDTRPEGSLEASANSNSGHSKPRPSEAERALLAEAVALREAHQRCQRVQAAMRAALDKGNGGAAELFMAVLEANEFVHQQRIAVSCSRAQQTVRLCRPVAKTLLESKAHTLGPALPSGFDLSAVRISHSYNSVWAAEQSALYNQLCDALLEAYRLEQEQEEETKPKAKATAVRATAGKKHTPQQHSCDNINEKEGLLSIPSSLASGTAATSSRVSKPKPFDTIKLKVHHQAQTRLFAFPSNSTFADVHAQLSAFCAAARDSSAAASGSDEALRVRYEDADGDYIVVLNEQDWALFLEEAAASQGGGGGKTDVYCDYPVQPSGAASPVLAPTPVESQHASPTKPRASHRSSGPDGPADSHATTTTAAAPAAATAAAPTRGRAPVAARAVTATKSSKLRAASAAAGAPRVKKSRPGRTASVASRRAAAAATSAATASACEAPEAVSSKPAAPAARRVRKPAAPLVPPKPAKEEPAQPALPSPAVDELSEMVRLQVAEAKRWDLDDEFQILEMQTTASGRSTAPAASATTRAAEAPSAPAPPSTRAPGGVAGSHAPPAAPPTPRDRSARRRAPSPAERAEPRSVPHTPQQDEEQQQQPHSPPLAPTTPPRTPASASAMLSMLPPRPQASSPAGKAAQPQRRARTRSSRRGTPSRRPGAAADDSDVNPDQHTRDLLAEMRQLQLSNREAMEEAKRKCN